MGGWTGGGGTGIRGGREAGDKGGGSGGRGAGSGGRGAGSGVRERGREVFCKFLKGVGHILNRNAKLAYKK